MGQVIGSLLSLAVAIGVARQQGRQSRKLFQDQVNHVSEEAKASAYCVAEGYS